MASNEGGIEDPFSPPQTSEQENMDTEPNQNAAQPQAAANAAMELPELLEPILLGLDFKTLLLAQRVSTKRRDLISRSQSCQKKLFFAPVEDFEEAVALDMVSKNALLLVEERYRCYIVTKESHTTLLNTHILYYDKDDQIYDWCTLRLRRALLRYTPSSRRGKSSWERVFLAQPPEQPTRVNAAGAEEVEKDADPSSGHKLWSSGWIET
ncbi:hypothetical protein LTR37_016213 [Vermiconidia calcicola]|uniref:Uncharacterized protein n=1 Tax=Vermiconidia calcicola TaxID=1690605 RepID=A0ACC3MNH4_9PEZI|nr:hypothetical protein LTR37_016213 [Vermiconidia calcicola]